MSSAQDADLKLVDFSRAPYVVIGVDHINLVPLDLCADACAGVFVFSFSFSGAQDGDASGCIWDGQHQHQTAKGAVHGKPSLGDLLLIG